MDWMSNSLESQIVVNSTPTAEPREHHPHEVNLSHHSPEVLEKAATTQAKEDVAAQIKQGVTSQTKQGVTSQTRSGVTSQTKSGVTAPTKQDSTPSAGVQQDQTTNEDGPTQQQNTVVEGVTERCEEARVEGDDEGDRIGKWMEHRLAMMTVSAIGQKIQLKLVNGLKPNVYTLHCMDPVEFTLCVSLGDHTDKVIVPFDRVEYFISSTPQ